MSGTTFLLGGRAEVKGVARPSLSTSIGTVTLGCTRLASTSPIYSKVLVRC